MTDFETEILEIWYFSWSFWTNSVLVFLKDKPIVELAWAISVWVSDWSIHSADKIYWERHLLTTNLKTIISFEIVLLTEFIFFWFFSNFSIVIQCCKYCRFDSLEKYKLGCVGSIVLFIFYVIFKYLVSFCFNQSSGESGEPLVRTSW